MPKPTPATIISTMRTGYEPDRLTAKRPAARTIWPTLSIRAIPQ
jgi:hypothetical protein